MTDPQPAAGMAGLQALTAGLPPEIAGALSQGLAGLSVNGTDEVTYVPWWGIGMGRQKDILGHKGSGDEGSARWDATVAGAKGEKVTNRGVGPITIPYAEMSTKEAFGRDATGELAQPLSPGQVAQQKLRDESKGDILKDAKQVYLDPYNWTQEQLADVGAEMISVGLLDDGPYSMPDFLEAWKQLIGQAVNYNAAKPGSLFTPLDMLDVNYKNLPGGDKLGPQASTTISKSQSISTNDDARYMLGNMMARELGRRPTAKEVDDFQANLNSAQRANPRTTTTTSTPASLSKSGNNESVSNTTGGVNEQQVAEDYVINNDPDSEYGRYQAATTYANALFQAIRSPV